MGVLLGLLVLAMPVAVIGAIVIGLARWIARR